METVHAEQGLGGRENTPLKSMGFSTLMGPAVAHALRPKSPFMNKSLELDRVGAGSDNRGMAATTTDIEPNDAELTQIIARREESRQAMASARVAYDQLYQRHTGRLLAFLSSRVEKHDLDDVHQEVWFRVWKALPSRFDGKDFRAWLFEIARNLILDRQRRRKPERLGEDAPIADLRMLPSEEYLLEKERRDILARCLDRLPPEVASVFRARLSGRDYDEICQAGAMTANRAQKLQHQAKKLLKSCVEAALA